MHVPLCFADSQLPYRNFGVMDERKKTNMLNQIHCLSDYFLRISLEFVERLRQNLEEEILFIPYLHSWHTFSLDFAASFLRNRRNLFSE